MHSTITGILAEQKLDKMIAEVIKAGTRMYSQRLYALPSMEGVSEVVGLLQIAFEDLGYWDAMAAFKTLAAHEGPEDPDYVELFLREVNRI